MSKPTQRVLALLELLQSGGIRTAAELADRLEVDERTVRRYVEHLLNLEIPVESVRGRYGGYRLGPGYRLPPLMLSDEEGLAVLLALAAQRRAGTATTADAASETAAAKIRRVLPERLARRLDAVVDSVAFTTARPTSVLPDSAILLPLADAVRHHRPVTVRYIDGRGRRSDRVLHPYGVVAHADRWYVTGLDPAVGGDRTLRLDRIAHARTLPGSFQAPSDLDPARRVLDDFATAAYQHAVTVHIHATLPEIRSRFPASVAVVVDEPSRLGPGETQTERWWRVEMRVEHLNWLPPTLVSLDRPFTIERPDQLRHLVTALAERLSASARAGTPSRPPSA